MAPFLLEVISQPAIPQLGESSSIVDSEQTSCALRHTGSRCALTGATRNHAPQMGSQRYLSLCQRVISVFEWEADFRPVLGV